MSMQMVTQKDANARDGSPRGQTLAGESGSTGQLTGGTFPSRSSSGTRRRPWMSRAAVPVIVLLLVHASTAEAVNFIAYDGFFCTGEPPIVDLTDHLSTGTSYKFAATWRYEYRYS